MISYSMINNIILLSSRFKKGGKMSTSKMYREKNVLLHRKQPVGKSPGEGENVNLPS